MTSPSSDDCSYTKEKTMFDMPRSGEVHTSVPLIDLPVFEKICFALYFFALLMTASYLSGEVADERIACKYLYSCYKK